MTRSGTSGALTAVRAAGAEPFSSSELGLMKTLAGQTAMAIERITLDGEVQAARLEAEASALRAALFSSVTHDLKTPLASIKASASGLLAEGARYTEAERRDVLRDVVHEADHLNLIVGNLLDLARIRAGALVPSKQPILIDEVIGSVLQRMRRALDGVVVRTTIRPISPRSTPIPSRSVKCSRTSSRTRSGSLRPGPRSNRCRSMALVGSGARDGSGPGSPPRIEIGCSRSSTGGMPAQVEGNGPRALDRPGCARGPRRHDPRERRPGGGTAVTFELPISKSEQPGTHAPAARGAS